MNKSQMFRSALGILLIALFVYLIDFTKTLNEIASADVPLYALGALLFFSGYITVSLRWQRLSNSIGYDLGFLESLKIIAAAYGFNQLLPGNSGDLARSKVMENYTEIKDHSSILGTVALERFYDAATVTVILVFSANLLAASYTSQVSWVLNIFSVALTGFVVFLFAAAYLDFETIWIVPDSVVEKVDLFVDGATSTSLWTTVENIFLTSYKWVAEVAVLYILGLSLGIDLGIWEAAFVTSSMSLVSALPITPAGLGPVEITGTGLLKGIGLPTSTAASLVILQRSIGVVLTAALGMIVYFKDFRGLDLKIR